MVDKNEFYHVFEANNLDHDNFNGTKAKLYFLNEDIEQESWYEDYIFDEVKLRLVKNFRLLQ